MSDVVNFPSVMGAADLKTALAQSQVQETEAGGGGFLKCDFESGEWTSGKEKDDVTDELILVNPATIKHGWILWSGGKSQKNMVPFTQQLPMPMDPIGADSPAEGRSFEGAMWDDGEPVRFDSSSYGGRKGVDTLLGHIKAKAASGSDFLYPLVKLTSENYANSKRGNKQTFNPVFEVTAWCDVDGNEEDAPAAQVEDKSEPQDAEPDEKPKRQRRVRAG